MTCYVVTDKNGQAVSIGTVIADPLPKGLTAKVVDQADYDALIAGTSTWDASTKGIVPAPEQPAPLIVQLVDAITSAKNFGDMKARVSDVSDAATGA